MNTILVPVDNGDASKNAVIYAAKLAADLGKNIQLINAYQVPISYTEVPLVTLSLAQIEEASKALLENYKNDIRELTTDDIEIYTESVYGEIENEIKKTIEKIEPYLIIIGTGGRSGLGKLFMGSTSLKIIKETKTPVLIVPPTLKYKRYQKIGLTSDFEEVIEHTSTKVISEIVGKLKANLTVIHVDYERYHFTASTPMETMNLDNMLTELKPTYSYIENKDTIEGIVNYVTENDIDLLVVFPKKHSWFEQIFEKSKTRQLIQAAIKPILCLRN
jgi:nucleotide-binding universal stress UspA family protein